MKSKAHFDSNILGGHETQTPEAYREMEVF